MVGRKLGPVRFCNALFWFVSLSQSVMEVGIYRHRKVGRGRRGTFLWHNKKWEEEDLLLSLQVAAASSSSSSSSFSHSIGVFLLEEEEELPGNLRAPLPLSRSPEI